MSHYMHQPGGNQSSNSRNANASVNVTSIVNNNNNGNGNGNGNAHYESQAKSQADYASNKSIQVYMERNRLDYESSKGQKHLDVAASGHYGNGNKQSQQQQQQQQQQLQLQQQQQQIQVQILPQDDNWGENTMMTGDFSDFNDNMTEDGRSSYYNPRFANSQAATHGAHNFAHSRGGGGGGGGGGGAFTSNSYHTNYHSHYSKDAIYGGASGERDHHSSSSLASCIAFARSVYAGMRRHMVFFCTLAFVLFAFLTPVVFVVLPQVGLLRQPEWNVSECGLECEGILIGIALKLFLLLFGNAILFVRRSSAQLPRAFELKSLLLFLLFIVNFSFWLFYGVRIIDTRLQDYHKILQFAASYVDVLLFIFIISVFVLELRHMQPQYVVRIVRSPDGQQAEYVVGNMSVQRAAAWLLQQYYKDFTVYNPWLETMHRKKIVQPLQQQQQQQTGGGEGGKKRSINTSRSGMSLMSGGEESDKGNSGGADSKQQRKRMNQTNASVVGGNYSAHDRFYEEYEYERRLRKRRARLLTSTEEAFAHIKRAQFDSPESQANGGAVPTGNVSFINTAMDPYETAQVVFSSIARDLKRYLRVTRQQPYFSRESIIAHLAKCISYDMSPRSFLQRYLAAEPLMFNQKAMLASSLTTAMRGTSLSLAAKHHRYHESLSSSSSFKANGLEQEWILISDTALYQSVEDNLMIVLKQNEVSLMCTFRKLPRFTLIEDIIDPKRNKFVLKLNSETTV